jgi:hypothetical protein
MQNGNKYMSPSLNIIAIVFFVILEGCVTPYQSNGLGGGYSDIALAPDIYKVSFRGNGYTSQDTVQNYLLRRCAEITLREGYSYFIILAGSSSLTKSYLSTPTTIQSRGYSNYNAVGSVYGTPSFANYSLNGKLYNNRFTTINQGSTYEIDKHTNQTVIKLLKNNKGISIALDAKTILNNYTQIK